MIGSFARADRLLERQFGGDHLFYITTKGILIPLREYDRSTDLLSVISIRRHLRELLPLRLDSTEIFVHPDNDVPFCRRLREFMKAVQCIE